MITNDGANECSAENDIMPCDSDDWDSENCEKGLKLKLTLFTKPPFPLYPHGINHC